MPKHLSTMSLAVFVTALSRSHPGRTTLKEIKEWKREEEVEEEEGKGFLRLRSRRLTMSATTLTSLYSNSRVERSIWPGR